MITPEILDAGLTVVIKALVILLPIFVAFYRKDRDALNRLLVAVPEIYDVVSQERRKQNKPALDNPLGRALELAKGVVQRPLTQAETDRMRIALQAHHEDVRPADITKPIGIPAS